MGIQKHVFRPSWLLNVGPGLIVTGILAVLIVPAVRARVLPPSLWLIPVAGIPLLCAYVRWLLKGCIIVYRDEITVRGWANRTDPNGSEQRVYIRQRIPRGQWNSITIEGLFFPRVILNRFGERVAFEQVSRPRLLSRLLTAQADEFAESEHLSLILIVLYGLIKLAGLVGWGLGQGIALVIWIAQRARQAWARRRQAPPPASPVRPLDYEHFCGYCAALCERRLSTVDPHTRRIYNAILERAHMMTTRANGHAPGVLHPRIQDIQEVTKRIPEATYTRMLRQALHNEPYTGSLVEPLIPQPVLH